MSPLWLVVYVYMSHPGYADGSSTRVQVAFDQQHCEEEAQRLTTMLRGADPPQGPPAVMKNDYFKCEQVTR
jgi:hypothetical protein